MKADELRSRMMEKLDKMINEADNNMELATGKNGEKYGTYLKHSGIKEAALEMKIYLMGLEGA